MGGRGVKTRKPYPYVHELTDRHGHRRAYLRKPGCPSVALPLPIGTRAFVEAYHAALESAPPRIVGRAKAGTWAALVQHYYASRSWLALSPQSQRTYRHILDRYVAAHGHRLVRQMEAKHVEAIIAAKASTPAAANKLRKMLGLLMRIGILHGYRKDNPVTAVKGMKIKSKGHKTWTDDEIATFEAHHPFGTEARLALSLLLCTGQRRSDVVRMGREHLSDGIITIAQAKTGEVVSIPILPALQKVLDEVQRRRITPTFIVTEYGHAFTEAGFTNKFRDWVIAAGLPKGLSPHGLRKAFCRVAAEAGLTPHQIMSISGHRTLAEVTRYTAAADKKKLAVEGMRMIEKRMEFGNPTAKVSNRPE
jgi:integrase